MKNLNLYDSVAAVEEALKAEGISYRVLGTVSHAIARRMVEGFPRIRMHGDKINPPKSTPRDLDFHYPGPEGDLSFVCCVRGETSRHYRLWHDPNPVKPEYAADTLGVTAEGIRALVDKALASGQYTEDEKLSIRCMFGPNALTMRELAASSDMDLEEVRALRGSLLQFVD